MNNVIPFRTRDQMEIAKYQNQWLNEKRFVEELAEIDCQQSFRLVNPYEKHDPRNNVYRKKCESLKVTCVNQEDW